MIENTTTIEFNAKALAPVSLFMADGDIRYYLNGIMVCPHPTLPGCVIVGTNGHQLAMWYDKDGICTEQKIFRVSKELISAAKRKRTSVKGASPFEKPKLGSKNIVRFEGGRLLLVSESGVELFVQAGKCEIEATYPNVFALVQKQTDGLKIGSSGPINGKYLRKIADAAVMVADLGLPVVTNWQKAGEENRYQAIISVFENVDKNFMVLTMPVKVHDKDELPECFFAEQPKPEPVIPAFLRKEVEAA